ncbi:threonine synthase [Caldisericum exile]|uniref:Threonine synthase n=1 Tax=Caldisericum exile (strain DSM 21853 / NBRC 104410 / AZM16c01) TaxID=511051 RepID=A0A7U6GEP7_CALEA|nr:threonine synthase [Caldisericum exile]BAL81023.1 threonine synthase [Caldisericum exile AZM16c01]
MGHVKRLKCLVCGTEYDENEVMYTCPKCGDNGLLEVEYDYESIKREFTKEYLSNNKSYSLWRYLPLLPINDPSKIAPLQVGFTPLYQVPRIREDLGVSNLFVKDDGRNPTASLKDRASAIVVSKAQELGKTEITCASTGNAASSLAGATASLGLKSYIFVPKNAPKAKLTQLLVFGATVFAVNGTYDEAFDLSIKATREFGWYNRNTGFNPYTVEGKKTVALEIAEQLSFDVPNYVFVSVGDGNIISGVYKGFFDLLNLGFIDRMPKIVAVQAEGCSPVVDAVNGDGIIKPVVPNTIADSISVGIPRSGIMAVKYIKNSNGFGIKVSDEEILKAIKYLGTMSGIFAEPAASTSFAGYLKALKEGLIKGSDKVVVIITGNGLKDIDSAMKSVKEPIYIDPTIEDVKRKVMEINELFRRR